MSKHNFTDIRVPIEPDNPSICRDEAKCIKCGQCKKVCTESIGVAGRYDLSLTGDNAIFEYVDGKLDIHHSKAYQVMTNSPVFDQQLALDDYWKNIGGTTFLPGTNRAADRFVRASFYINALPKTEDTRTALASVFSVIRNTSVPFGISTPDQPNISSTRWRTVSDQKDKVYYFESTLYPNVFWIDFKDVDFSEKAPVKKLNLLSGKTYAGNTAKEFVVTKPFQFLGIK